MVVEQLKEARVAPVDTRRGRVAPKETGVGHGQSGLTTHV